MQVRPPSYHLLATGQIEAVPPLSRTPRPVPLPYRSAGSFLPRFRHHRRRRPGAAPPAPMATAR